ncbi:MAG TPA: ATP-binding protein [Acidimicrobiales bacterium]|nr:ATP-binding protein [Acidimicrobiales bacterium]
MRLRPSTVRVRTTVGAVVVVALALLVGAVGLVLSMRRALAGNVRTAAELRAADVVTLLSSGSPPSRLAAGDDEDLLVQVLDRSGAVVAASDNLAGRPAIARLRPGEAREVDVPVDDDTYLAVAAATTTDRGPVTVVVARTLETVEESTDVVVRLLAVGLPVLLLVVGGTTWKVTGRALAPVGAIRREVDEISSAHLDRRVPMPPGADEVARLAATMNRMLDRLERSQVRQRRFVSDASHELHSPVASIRQHAEVALAHPDRMTVEGLAAPVLAEELRLERLVDDLLLLARLDEQTLPAQRRPVDLDDIVLEEARRLRQTASVAVDTTAVSAARVAGDAASLRRVLRNVADNAARHCRSRVAFALRQDAGEVVVEVDDDGPGIPLADRQRVFDRFVRLDDARARDGGGSGLGLAIVAEVVAAHGGAAAIVASPLGGARVRITLSAEPQEGIETIASQPNQGGSR